MVAGRGLAVAQRVVGGRSVAQLQVPPDAGDEPAELGLGIAACACRAHDLLCEREPAARVFGTEARAQLIDQDAAQGERISQSPRLREPLLETLTRLTCLLETGIGELGSEPTHYARAQRRLQPGRRLRRAQPVEDGLLRRERERAPGVRERRSCQELPVAGLLREPRRTLEHGTRGGESRSRHRDLAELEQNPHQLGCRSPALLGQRECLPEPELGVGQRRLLHRGTSRGECRSESALGSGEALRLHHVSREQERVVATPLLERIRDAQVLRGGVARSGAELRVDSLGHERVGEAAAGAGSGLEEPGARRLVERMFERALRTPFRFPDQRCIELEAHRRCGPEQPPSLVRQRRAPAFQQRLDARRQLGAQGAARIGAQRSAFGLDRERDFEREERVSFRPPREQLGGPRRDLEMKTILHQRPQLVRLETAQREDLGRGLRCKRAELSKARVADRERGPAHAPQHPDARRVQRRCEIAQERQRVGVCELQVVEREQERLDARAAQESARHLAELREPPRLGAA